MLFDASDSRTTMAQACCLVSVNVHDPNDVMFGKAVKCDLLYIPSLTKAIKCGITLHTNAGCTNVRVFIFTYTVREHHYIGTSSQVME